ncbi:lipase family protein (macronuclear) [Tetrahymena thermophila SB210]|uniref:Lipase family protein n=1 Tax=Tetrahymena thermophila (strain SB210) TaxID=312017 RepID=Q22E19_TETTS|nr:lipase family protein [Tetrahymena thermophila SB210]EAR83493.2 lipase family protein [Tetrahymena thermophila SB210]|eukprot:XP_001031156.2 lipase family protein [Tetrahymena thermophila SB210]
MKGKMLTKQTNQKIFSILTASLVILYTNAFQYNVDLSKRLASYSLVSYCSHNRLQDWSCGEACQRVEPLKDLIIYTNQNDSSYMMGYDQQENAISIIVKGTNPWCIDDWESDLTTEKIDYPKCESCQVHKVFYQTLLDMQEQLKKDFLKIRSQHPQSKIYATGQSLGGALATLIVPEIYLLNGKKPIDAFYTFGSPRVGNLQFSFWYTSKSYFSKISARVTSNKDIVAQLPPRSFPFLYMHIGHEVFYKNFSNLHEFIMCEIPEDQECSNQYTLDFSMKDHGSYFGWNWAFDIFTC